MFCPPQGSSLLTYPFITSSWNRACRRHSLIIPLLCTETRYLVCLTKYVCRLTWSRTFKIGTMALAAKSAFCRMASTYEHRETCILTRSYRIWDLSLGMDIHTVAFGAHGSENQISLAYCGPLLKEAGKAHSTVQRVSLAFCPGDNRQLQKNEDGKFHTPNTDKGPRFFLQDESEKASTFVLDWAAEMRALSVSLFPCSVPFLVFSSFRYNYQCMGIQHVRMLGSVMFSSTYMVIASLIIDVFLHYLFAS